MFWTLYAALAIVLIACAIRYPDGQEIPKGWLDDAARNIGNGLRSARKSVFGAGRDKR